MGWDWWSERAEVEVTKIIEEGTISHIYYRFPVDMHGFQACKPLRGQTAGGGGDPRATYCTS